MRKVSKTLCNSLRWAALNLGLFAILVDLTPVPNFYLIMDEKLRKLRKSLRWFGDFGRSNPSSRHQVSKPSARHLVGLSQRLVWYFVFEKFDWLVALQCCPLNKKVSKNPFWISSNISLLELNWLEKCLKTLNFWLAGNLFSKTGKTERNWSTRKSSPSRFPNFASRTMFHNSKKCLQPNGKCSLKEARKERKREHTVRKTFLGKSCVFFWDLLLRILDEVGKLLLVRRTSFFPPVGEKPHKLCWTLFSYFTLS